jgi:steroid 5-alpha reductase family enzyme
MAPGIVVMLAGLALETLADAQKSRFKAMNPKAFVSGGLFAIVRSPNYAGEMLFWFGAFLSGLAVYESVAAWLIALTGLVCIELIMLGSARRLELKQIERYGDDPAYRDYAARVPVLFPLVPLYSLKGLRIYLG